MGMVEKIDTLVAYCRENSRVCPKPSHWNDLWKMLPKSRTTIGESAVSAPLILGAWYETTNLEKMIRLDEHIRWAADNALLPQVSQFLHALGEAEWHHLGD